MDLKDLNCEKIEIICETVHHFLKCICKDEDIYRPAESFTGILYYTAPVQELFNKHYDYLMNIIPDGAEDLCTLKCEEGDEYEYSEYEYSETIPPGGAIGIQYLVDGNPAITLILGVRYAGE